MFGVEVDGTCYGCLRASMRMCMLPTRPDIYELLVVNSSRITCIKPRVFAKGVCRAGCCIHKFAFPCDNEVPCALALCGVKCFEKPPGKPILWCRKSAAAINGRRPMFPVLETQGPMSKKAPGGPANAEMHR